MRLWLLRESWDTEELIDARDGDRGFLFGFGFGFADVCLVRLGIRASASFFTRFEIRVGFGGVASSELRHVDSGVVGVGVSVRDVGDGEEIGDGTDMMFSFARSSFVRPPLLADDKSTHGKTGLGSSGNQSISKDV